MTFKILIVGVGKTSIFFILCYINFINYLFKYILDLNVMQVLINEFLKQVNFIKRLGTD